MTAQDMKKETCRYCDARLPEPFLDLGAMALANSFVAPSEAGWDEFQCPLSVTRCGNCGLVQLSHVVPPELMFTNYLYVSSTTKTFRDHFARYAKSVKQRSLKTQNLLAVDIGSNDGLLLSCFMNEGMRAVGVEPAKNLSETANREGRVTLNAFFGAETVASIVREHGRADVVTANNVFAHIDDSKAVVSGVRELLDDRGLFVIEFPYLVTMLDDMLFDMIYHEHLSYIALTPLKKLLADFEMEVFAVDRVPSHGGSLRVFIQKKNGGHPVGPEVAAMLKDEENRGFNGQPAYDAFAKRVYGVRDALVRFVNEAKARGEVVCGYGAPAKGNTLINFCGFGPKLIDYIVEDNPLKQGTLAPGSKIPVVAGTHMESHPPGCVILFAWNFAKEILEKLDPWRKKGVRFVVPLPVPTLV